MYHFALPTRTVGLHQPWHCFYQDLTNNCINENCISFDLFNHNYEKKTCGYVTSRIKGGFSPPSLTVFFFSTPNQNEKSLSFYKGRRVELDFRRIEFNTQLSKNRVALLFNPSSSFDPSKTISIPSASPLPDSTPAWFIFDSYATRLSENQVCITVA